jgi:hypothetical protein
MGALCDKMFRREGAGTLTFEFDNSFSYWRSKQLSFDVYTTHRAPLAVHSTHASEVTPARRTSSVSKNADRDSVPLQRVTFAPSHLAATPAAPVSAAPPRQQDRGLWETTEYEVRVWPNCTTHQPPPLIHYLPVLTCHAASQSVKQSYVRRKKRGMFCSGNPNK